MGTKTKIAGLMIMAAALSASVVYADNGGNFAGSGDMRPRGTMKGAMASIM